MSQQAVYNVDFKDEELLLDALKDMGYNPLVHEEAVPIKIYGSRSGVKAHIVIGQQQGGFSYADIGFERTKGGYNLHADHIDINKFSLTKLKQKYTKAFIAKRIRLMGTQFLMGDEDIDEDGIMKLKIKVME